MADVALRPPLSKSDAQRALVLAEVVGRPLEDVLADGGTLPGDVQVLRDGLLALRGAQAEVDCRDGGAPFRFLLAQAALRPGHVTRFSGTPRLGARPHDALVEALERALGPAGLRVERGAPWPVTVRAPATLPRVDRFAVRGADTSQAVSSLLLGAARLVRAQRGPVEVAVEGPLASAGYVALTVFWLRAAGFDVEATDGTYRLSSAGRAPTWPPVPGDWSAIAPLLLFAWRAGACVERVSLEAPHPDRAIVALLSSVGLTLEPAAADTVRLFGTPRGGLDVDVSASPDVALVLGALACVLPERSTFRQVGILRHKESDRLEGLVQVTRAGGASVERSGDVVTVTPGPPPAALTLDARGDHRLAMAAACLAVLTGVPLTLTGAFCVTKSFPDFWAEVAKVGFRFEAQE